jgi:phosphatidylglycerol lysyltransferase
LDNPLDRRYFYAKDRAGQVVAFNVFLPFAGMTGWMADVTRRLRTAPGGVTEKVTYEAFQQFKAEGYTWGSLGVSPLADTQADRPANKIVGKALRLIYEKGNQLYGFKSLHHAKAKYGPTEWRPVYLVYAKGTMGLDMAMAITRVKDAAVVGIWARRVIAKCRKVFKGE